MRHRIFYFTGVAMVFATASAATDTVIITETMPDGTVVDRTVEQIQVPNSSPNLEFAAADKDGDGRVSRQEAHDMGILGGNFDRYAGGKAYLTQQEYEAALVPPQ